MKDSWIVNQFIAHRGFYNDEAPENTLGAFKRAIEHNYAIECDIRQLADGTLVIFHDETLSRVCGVDGYIEKFTLEEISKFRIKNTNYKIPTLKEMLELVNGQVPILFEIKNFNRKKVGEIESKLCEELLNYKGKYAVESFNPFVIEWFKKNHPEIVRGILSSSFKGDENNTFKTSFIVRYVLSHLKLNKKIEPDFIAYRWNNLPNRFVKKNKNIPVIAWTIRSQEEYLKIVKYADNIIFEGFEPQI